MPEPEATREARTAWLGTFIVAIAIGVLATVAMQPRITGQFHDDAIYLSTARSLADGDGYRHASLPSAPVQTKYPPLYSAVLAGVWKIAPEFPDNARWFKMVSVLCLTLTVVFAGVLAMQRLGGSVAPPVFAFMVGASPLAFPFADYALTELPFLALCMAAMCLAPVPSDLSRAGSGTPMTSDADARTGLRRAVLLGAVCGLAMLVRQAALPLILAGAASYAAGRRWRPLLGFLVTVAVFVLPWVWFKTAQSVADPNPLVAYYVSYEPSVLELALRDPGLAANIVISNLVYLWSAFELSAYLVYYPAVRILLYPVFIVGLWKVFRPRVDFLAIFAVLYGGLIVLWPWQPSRYAIPLAPIVPLSLFLAGRTLERRLDPSAATGPGWERIGRRTLPWLPVALFALLSIGWIQEYSRKEADTTRAAFLVRLEYAWSGFEETARWIEQNTASDALLASAYDPLYFLYTGRRGVRPWLHRPWTYFYPITDPAADIGSASTIRPALDELSVDYLVIDPLDGYVEGDAAADLWEDLLRTYRGPAYEGEPRLRFTSADGLHRVYELPRRAAVGTGVLDPRSETSTDTEP